MHHFRTHNLKLEESHLKACWKKCIDDKIILPIENIRTYNEDGELLLVQTAETTEETATTVHTDREITHMPQTPNVQEVTSNQQPQQMGGSHEPGAQDHPVNSASVVLTNMPQTAEGNLHSCIDLPSLTPHMDQGSSHTEYATDPTTSDEENEVLDVREISEEFLSQEHKATDTPIPHYNPLTHLGKQVLQLISDRQLTKKFDRLRSAIKSSDSNVREHTRQQTAKKVKENLIMQFKECKRNILEWEQAFITNHGMHPNPDNIPDIIAKAMRRKRKINNILCHEWKLNLNRDSN